ncbi:MAG: cofactor-independent phosphoglycerate mutase [Candidatus Omnitrophota bacterium]|jgi:2,3-bisphosphoglycerate-independent phosphoglycerate mutase
MKYIVLVADGMADYPIVELNDRTPLEAARTPHLDYLARNGRVGRVKTIPDKMSPASDVANISILGYDPKLFYTGRGPLEAANLGVELNENDVAFRFNLITACGDTLTDYSAGHISSKEGTKLVEYINKTLGNQQLQFYPGISYRNLLVVKNGAREHLDKITCKAPHDILGQPISEHLPKGENAALLIKLMRDSQKLLEAHEINQVRLDLKENPANMIWLWGQGKKPAMPKFIDKFGVNGSVISAVDLIKGLGRILGLDVIDVPGATGYYDTNYKGKAKAALRCLKEKDFVFVHVEAPDEAGHNGDLREKITAIERFDQFIVGTILDGFKNKEKFRLIVLPDHPTPVSLRTHTNDPVPFVIFGKDIVGEGCPAYSEKEAEKSSLFFEKGHEIMNFFLGTENRS